MSTDADMTAPRRSNRWVLAARPYTLPAAIAPVLVGSGLAVRDGAFRSDVLLVTMLAALAIQIGVNFANDVADAAKGADTDERIGPTRAVASGLVTPGEMWRAIAVVFGFAALGGIYLATVAGPVIIVIGVASLIAALGYTNGPIPYGYYGLGEVFVFVFFGLVATVGTRLAYDGSIGGGAWNAGIIMGCLASAILVANNIRDLDTDRKAAKRTLAVILGRKVTRALYGLLLAAPYAIVVLSIAIEAFQFATTAVFVTIPLAYRPISLVYRHEDGPRLIQALKDTGRVQLAFAVILAFAIALSG